MPHRPVRPAPAAGSIVHPARDPVGADEAVLGVRVLAHRDRGVVRVVHGSILGMDGRLPVHHLGIRLGAAEQAVGSGPLEELLEAPVREGEDDVHVLADHVEQAREALAHLREPRGRIVARGDVRDDAGDAHGAVGVAAGASPVPHEPRDAVEPDQAVGDLGVLAEVEALVEALVVGLVVRVDAGLPEAVPSSHRHRSAKEASELRPGAVADVAAVRGDRPRVHMLLEQVENLREVVLVGQRRERREHRSVWFSYRQLTDLA